MDNFSSFKRHVDEIHTVAKIVIEKHSSKAEWPTITACDAGAEGTKVTFSKPAILWDAPIRGSSSHLKTKRAIVMDGIFYFKNGAFDKGGASLEVYSVARPPGQCQLKLLEAMHFDIEPNSLQSPFHPMFHVQFGKNSRWDLNALRDSVSKLARLDLEQVAIDRDLNVPTRDVRIPTPQMDYLSMLVMVVADYFCEKNSSHEVKTGFKNLLRKVMDPRNDARRGRQSIRLEERWSDEQNPPFSAAHWYQESCRS